MTVGGKVGIGVNRAERRVRVNPNLNRLFVFSRLLAQFPPFPTFSRFSVEVEMHMTSQ